MNEELIRVDRLTMHFPLQKGLLANLFVREKRFVHAVNSVSFAIAKGEVLGLVGESGSGKTTTGRMILRLLEPTAGEVFYKQDNITAYSARDMECIREKMQVIFQDPFASLSPRMSIGDAISHPLKIHGLAKGAAARDMTLAIMEKVGLSPAPFLYRKYPHQISGGQRQRAVIARALITRPDFVVADEPIAMADVSVRAMILDLMAQLKEEFELTYLFITHDLATCKYICDHIAIMYLGRIVEIGPLRSVFSNPVHPYTATLLDAVPVPDPRYRRTHRMPRGEIPSPIDLPPGCSFHTRCPFARESCRVEVPALTEVGGAHAVACPVRAGSRGS